MAINLRDPRNDWDTCLGQGYDAPPLLVRPCEKSGLESLRSFMADNRIYTHIWDLMNEEDGLAWLDRALGNRHYRFFSILRSKDGARVGFLVFQYLPGQGIRIGGAIDPDHWRRGYASAVILGLKTHLGRPSFPFYVFADIHPDNTFVRRAFEKSGWHLLHDPASKKPMIYVL